MKLSTRHSWARVGPPRTALGAIAALAGSAIIAAVLVLPLGLAMAESSDIVNPSNPFKSFSDEAGQVLTVKGQNCVNTPGAVNADVCNTGNPFLTINFGQGTDNTTHGNGQACETCHQPQLGWSITPEFLRERFDNTDGTADQFRVNDTATDPRVCGTPTSNTESVADIAKGVNACVNSMREGQKKQAYQLFLDQGVHRIAIKVNGQTIKDPATGKVIIGAPNDDFVLTAATTKEFGSLPIPAGLDSQQPCAIQGAICVPTASVIRRPLLTVNVAYDSAVLWDGRQNVCVEVITPPTAPPIPPGGVSSGGGACSLAQLKTPLLENQVSGAAQTLLLSSPPTTLNEDKAAHLMTGLFTAQNRDEKAGSLQSAGAKGGPQFLADLFAGQVLVNGDVTHPPCTPLVEASKANSGAGFPPTLPPTGCADPRFGQKGFNIFSSWSHLNNVNDPCQAGGGDEDISDTTQARLLIACGEQIFNTRAINDPVVGRDANNIPNARCTSCHAAENVGTNPSPNFLLPYTPGGGIGQKPDLFVGGLTDASQDVECLGTVPDPTPNDPFCASKNFKLPQFQERTERLPLYTLTCVSAPPNPTCTLGDSIQLTDPGQALITHKFGSAGAMKPPQLRDLAARAPFFHNGAAKTLDDLVDFYNQNFSIGLTNHEHRALVAFLSAL